MTIVSNSITLHRKAKDGAAGKDAVLYTLDAPTTLKSGTEGTAFTIIRTTGAQRTVWDHTHLQTIQTEGITVEGQYLRMDSSMFRLCYYPAAPGLAAGTYTYRLKRNGTVLCTHTIAVVKDGQDGAPGQPGPQGPPGVGLTPKGTAINHYATYSEYSRASKVTGRYLVGQKNEFISGQGARLFSGAYLYDYDAQAARSTISDPAEGDFYISEADGHLYSANRNQEYLTLGNNLYWYDAGTIRGVQGYEGCIIRRSEWEAGKTYRNDSDLSPTQVFATYGDTTRYIDEVVISDYDGGNGYAYLCLRTHVSSADNRPLESGGGDPAVYWQMFDNQTRPLRTPFADITRAFIQYLQAQQIVITEGNTPYGAFGGGAQNPYPLWFGGIDSDHARVRFHRTGYQEFLGVNNTPNIRIGTDSNGIAVLKFYDGAGNEKYNLGYMGLSEIVATAQSDHYEPLLVNVRYVGTDTPASITPSGTPVATVMQRSLEIHYRFLCSYFLDASGKKVKTGSYITYDEKIYPDQSGMPSPSKTLTTGTYAFFGTRPVQTPSGLNKYVVTLYRIDSGILRDTYTRYYDYDTSGTVILYDAQGSTPLADQRLYVRDYWS